MTDTNFARLALLFVLTYKPGKLRADFPRDLLKDWDGSIATTIAVVRRMVRWSRPGEIEAELDALLAEGLVVKRAGILSRAPSPFSEINDSTASRLFRSAFHVLGTEQGFRRCSHLENAIRWGYAPIAYYWTDTSNAGVDGFSVHRVVCRCGNVYKTNQRAYMRRHAEKCPHLPEPSWSYDAEAPLPLFTAERRGERNVLEQEGWNALWDCEESYGGDEKALVQVLGEKAREGLDRFLMDRSEVKALNVLKKRGRIETHKRPGGRTYYTLREAPDSTPKSYRFNSLQVLRALAGAFDGDIEDPRIEPAAQVLTADDPPEVVRGWAVEFKSGGVHYLATMTEDFEDVDVGSYDPEQRRQLRRSLENLAADLRARVQTLSQNGAS